GLLTVFITGERMAFIIIFSGAILTLIGFFIECQTTRLHLVLILMLGLISFLTFSSFNPETAQRTFFSAIEKIQYLSTSDYGIVFKSAYDVWLESPILGVGIHQYRQACIDLELWGTGPGVCWHPHNISLELLSETGIIGFLLFYTIIISILIKIMKSFSKSKNWILLTLLLTFFFVCFFPFTSGISIFNNGFATIIWLMMGWLFVCIKMRVK
ncbi:MAG: O-antigen ligase family protein, partial [Methylophilaceae bacterium]